MSQSMNQKHYGTYLINKKRTMASISRIPVHMIPATIPAVALPSVCPPIPGGKVSEESDEEMYMFQSSSKTTNLSRLSLLYTDKSVTG